MELRYRRRMKMPVWSLPGFSGGHFGMLYNGSLSNDYQRDSFEHQPTHIGTLSDYITPNYWLRPLNTVDDFQEWGPYIQGVSEQRLLIPSHSLQVLLGSSEIQPWLPTTNWQHKQQPALDTSVHMNLGDWDSNGKLKTEPDTILGESTAPKAGTLGAYDTNGVGSIFGKQGNAGPAGGNTPGNGFKLNRVSGLQWGLIGQAALGMAAAGILSFGPVASQGTLLANAGLRVAHGADYDWTKQNNIDTAGEMSDLRKENTANTLKATSAGIGLGTAVGTGIGMAAGAAAGSVAGPIGAAAGAVIGLGVGLLGAGHRKAKLRRLIFNAQQQVNRINTFNNASAQTGALLRNYLSEYGNPYGGSIYNAKYGKDSGTAITARTRARLFNSKLSLPDVNKG